MATTSLVLRTDSDEYSRYWDPKRVITAHVHATGAADGTSVIVTLVREDGIPVAYGAVSTKTVTTTTQHVDVVFDLDKDCFDSDGFYRAKQSKYHIHAVTQDNQTAADSATFDIMVVCVDELKSLYLMGVDLLATNVVKPRVQPQTVTGVQIVDSSTTQFDGIFTLTYTNATTALAWDGGTAVTIDITKPVVRTSLVNARANAYVDILVTSENLPTTDKTESIIMDYAQITDDQIRAYLKQAYGAIQGQIYVKLEPTTVNTETTGSLSYDGLFYDERAESLTYYRQDWFTKWFTLKTTYPYVQKVHMLEAWFNATRAASIPVANWIVKNTVAGMLEFVPSSGAVLSFFFYGVPSFAFMTAYAHIPSFWHYKMTVGLPDLKNEDVRVRARQLVARRAAIDVLQLAGLASAPGLTGESTSRDGISQSRSYFQGVGGRYSALIAAHQQFLYGDGKGTVGEIARVRQRLIGLNMVTL